MPVAAPASFTPLNGNMEPHGRLRVEGNTIYTPGGYKVEFLGNTTWKITSPDGKSTKIWGDPHVHETDGGRWDWDDKTMTFTLPDGTKITANATGKLGVTTDVHVYYGNQRISVNGVDGKPQIGQLHYDGYAHDVQMRDGSRVFLGGDGDDWFKEAAGGREIIGGGGYSDLKLGKNFWVGGDLLTRMLDGIHENRFKFSYIDAAREERDKEIRELLAMLRAGGGSFEDRIMALMVVAIKNEEARALRLAEKLDGMKRDDDRPHAGTLDNFRLQQSVQRMNRLYQMLSNIVKTIHEMKMTSVRHMKA
jgi:hypothetical protein